MHKAGAQPRPLATPTPTASCTPQAKRRDAALLHAMTALNHHRMRTGDKAQPRLLPLALCLMLVAAIPTGGFGCVHDHIPVTKPIRAQQVYHDHAHEQSAPRAERQRRLATTDWEPIRITVRPRVCVPDSRALAPPFVGCVVHCAAIVGQPWAVRLHCPRASRCTALWNVVSPVLRPTNECWQHTSPVSHTHARVTHRWSGAPSTPA